MRNSDINALLHQASNQYWAHWIIGSIRLSSFRHFAAAFAAAATIAFDAFAFVVVVILNVCFVYFSHSRKLCMVDWAVYPYSYYSIINHTYTHARIHSNKPAYNTIKWSTRGVLESNKNRVNLMCVLYWLILQLVRAYKLRLSQPLSIQQVKQQHHHAME